MLKEKQLVVDFTALASLDQMLLQHLGRGIVEFGIATETATDQSRLSGKSWRKALIPAMKRSAVAPSMMRWSKERARYIM